MESVERLKAEHGPIERACPDTARKSGRSNQRQPVSLKVSLKASHSGHFGWGSKMATIEERLKGAPHRLIILAACAFARTAEHLLTGNCFRDAIDVAERFTDGLASPADLMAARAAQRAADAPRTGMASDAAEAARVAVGTAWALFAVEKGVQWSVELVAKTSSVWAAKVLPEATIHLILDCLLPNRIQSSFPANVQGLAANIYDKRDWPLMPILADALEEIGQDEMAVHCRQPIHAKGCHVLDSILAERFQ